MMSFTTYKRYYQSDSYNYPISNILQVSNPESYTCEVTAFQKTHSVLTIHCGSRDENVLVPAFKLQFHLFSYLELIPVWHGLDIVIAPPEECFGILNQIVQGIEQMPDEVLNQRTLYKFQSTTCEVKIIAHNLVAYPLHTKEEYIESLK